MACEHFRGRGRTALGRLFASILVLTVSGAEMASAQTAPVPPPTAVPVDPVLAASRVAFEALAEAERKAIQDDLVWASSYRGTVDGGFGRGTYAALMEFERAARRAPDGILDADERKALAQLAEAGRRAVGWRVVDEPDIGARIGYPARMLNARRPSPTRVLFSSDGGALVLNVQRVAGGVDGLAPLYEQMKAEQPGRKVTYAVLRPTWFVLTAEAGGRRTYRRFAQTLAGPVGFTFAYDAGFADGERLAVAIANAFQPLADAAAAAPRPVTVETVKPAAVPVVEPPAAGLVAASAYAIAPGRAITAAVVARACKTLTVRGKPVRVASVKGEVAMIEGIDGSTFVADVSLKPSAGGSDAVVALLRGPNATMVATGTLLGSPSVGAAAPRVLLAATRGIVGAPVFDRAGELVGLVGGPETEPRSVGSVAPEMALPLVSARVVGEALGWSQGSETPQSGAALLTAGEIMRLRGASLVPMTCGQ